MATSKEDIADIHAKPDNQHANMTDPPGVKLLHWSKWQAPVVAMCPKGRVRGGRPAQYYRMHHTKLVRLASNRDASVVGPTPHTSGGGGTDSGMSDV